MSILDEFTISVIVATFGDSQWRSVAHTYALPSIHEQTLQPHEIIPVHGPTLAAARNQGAQEASGEWLLFVDADDRLDEFYVEVMTAAISMCFARSDSKHWLLQPSTKPLDPTGDPEHDRPNLIPPFSPNLRAGNHLVIGTAVERSVFMDASGFGEEPVLEDWSLWLRCWALGAKPVAVEGAVYLVNERPVAGGKRNRNPQGVRRTILLNFDAWCRHRRIAPETVAT